MAQFEIIGHGNSVEKKSLFYAYIFSAAGTLTRNRVEKIRVWVRIYPLKSQQIIE